MFVRLKVEVLVPDGPEQELRDCEIDEEGSGIVVVVVEVVVVVDVVVVIDGGGFGLTVNSNPEPKASCSFLQDITVFALPSES